MQIIYFAISLSVPFASISSDNGEFGITSKLGYSDTILSEDAVVKLRKIACNINILLRSETPSLRHVEGGI